MKRLSVLLLIVLLVGVSITFAQDAPDITTEDQGSIEVGASVEGEFAAGARDRYTLETGDFSSVYIYLDGEGETDTYLRVYREDEEQPFAENDDRGDGTLFSSLEGLEVSPGETIIIEVGTFGDEGEGAYSLRVSQPPTAEDMGEITLGEPVDGTFEEFARERYTLTVDETSVLSIQLGGADDLDTYLRIYTDEGTTPAVQNDDLEPGNFGSGYTGLVVPGGTTLTIEAGTFGDAGTGDYQLLVEESDAAIGDAAEPVELDSDFALEAVCEGADTTDDPARLQYLTAEDVLEEGVDYGAVFCTEAGSFLVDLYEVEAPIATNSFVYLASTGFFDNTTFHRVIPEFVVQGGDPTGTGYGGPGYEFVNETDNDLTFGDVGVLGMANAGPDTNGSQFFITLAPVERLDGGYTIFGQVKEGMDSVFAVEERDPATATEPGTTLYRVIITTQPAE